MSQNIVNIDEHKEQKALDAQAAAVRMVTSILRAHFGRHAHQDTDGVIRVHIPGVNRKRIVVEVTVR
jgi:hypothetical protein